MRKAEATIGTSVFIKNQWHIGTVGSLDRDQYSGVIISEAVPDDIEKPNQTCWRVSVKLQTGETKKVPLHSLSRKEARVPWKRNTD